MGDDQRPNVAPVGNQARHFSGAGSIKLAVGCFVQHGVHGSVELGEQVEIFLLGAKIRRVVGARIFFAVFRSKPFRQSWRRTGRDQNEQIAIELIKCPN